MEKQTGGTAKCSWGKENIDITSGGGQQSGMGQQSYGNASNSASSAAATAAALAAAQNAAAASQLTAGANSAWTTAAASANPNWANYQWAAAAAGYPQNTMNYWQGYPGYQNAAMMQQTWGVMPTAGGGNATAQAAATQYQMGQYQQGTNGKS